MTASLGSINLLEWLTELRKTLYLLDYPFVGFPGGAVVRIRLPLQGTRVRALAREDPTCHGATKPMRHNY